jgi:hypothetical protein
MLNFSIFIDDTFELTALKRNSAFLIIYSTTANKIS